MRKWPGYIYTAAGQQAHASALKRAMWMVWQRLRLATQAWAQGGHELRWLTRASAGATASTQCLPGLRGSLPGAVLTFPEQLGDGKCRAIPDHCSLKGLWIRTLEEWVWKAPLSDNQSRQLLELFDPAREDVSEGGSKP